VQIETKTIEFPVLEVSMFTVLLILF